MHFFLLKYVLYGLQSILDFFFFDVFNFLGQPLLFLCLLGLDLPTMSIFFVSN